VLQVPNPYQTNTTERGKLSTGKYTNSQLGKRYRLAPELFQVKAAKGPPNIVLVFWWYRILYFRTLWWSNSL